MTLAAGANIPIAGREAQVTVSASDLGGVLVIVEEGGALRALAASDALAPVSPDARVTVVLPSVPEAVERLRVLAYSTARTRALEPARAEIVLDGEAVATIEVATGQSLRVAELVEIYRRHGQWKVRAVASGWIGGVEAASSALGVPASAFAQLAPAGVSADPGPALLRALVDEIVGPGERIGGHNYLEFKLGGAHDASIVLDGVTNELSSVTAVLPLGEAYPDGPTAEAAARTSGEVPMGRIAFDGGHAYASASTVVDHTAIDTAVLKALLSEAWATALDFARRTGRASLPETPPRELRLGVAEELGEQHTWGEIRELLLANGFMVLVDAPEACLAPADGTLWLGPVRLAGSARSWSVLCERVVRADAELSSEAWRSIAEWNSLSGPLRLGVVQEVGAGAQPAVVLSFNALQVQRGQPRRDLEVGLSMVDERAGELEPGMRQILDGTSHRNNLPWFAGRRWSGPGREIADDILARELSALPEGAAPPADFLDRVRARGMGRGEAGYLAHLALQRVERGERDWLPLASALVELAPVEMGPDGTATASVWVRRSRLERSFSPAPAPASPPPAPRRRRWFGG